MRHRRAPLAAALACAAAALVPTAANADSLVYVKGGNVWLAEPDGSKQTQVTTDGSADQPYRSPSQADDGTIAASHGQDIVLLRQNGEVIRALDPPALTDSTSHPVDGTPVYVGISPDATKVAWSFANYSCPVGADCAARATTGAMPAKGGSTYGQVYYGDPKWITGTRLMVFGGYLGQVNLWDLGASDRFHWFDDQDWAGRGNSTDLGDGDLSRDGRLWVGVRGYDSDSDRRYRHAIWFRTLGNPSTDSPPPVPEATCTTEQVKGLNGPTIAPSGDAFAFATPEGVRVFRNVFTDPARCGEANDTLVLAGASEPDWGPADVNPQPRVPRLTVSKARLGRALKRGLKVGVTNAPGGTLSLTAKGGGKVVARGSREIATGGAGTVTLRFTKAARRKLARARSARLAVSGAGAARKVTLRR